MKRTFATLFLTSGLLLTFLAPAVSQPVNLEHIKNAGEVIDRYKKALNHENPGVVESTIFCVITMRWLYPGENYDKIADELAHLAVEGPTPTIRYKSFIAANYLQHPEWFQGSQEEIQQAYSRPERVNPLFVSLLNRMESRRLGD